MAIGEKWRLILYITLWVHRTPVLLLLFLSSSLFKNIILWIIYVIAGSLKSHLYNTIIYTSVFVMYFIDSVFDEVTNKKIKNIKKPDILHTMGGPLLYLKINI